MTATPTPSIPPTIAPTASPAPVTGTPVAIVVSSASSGNVLPSFNGFSYEKEVVGADMFDASNTNLVNLFKLLGPGVLRIGGNLVDIVTWTPSGPGGQSANISPPDVAKLAGFLKATGWQVLYGINLKTNTPSNAASEASYAAGALGSSLLAFEIGNEPNIYDSEAAYEAAFNADVKAIQALVPGAKFDGAGGTDTSWLPSFAQNEKANLLITTVHAYVGGGATGTMSAMLGSTAPGAFLPNTELAMENAKAATGVPQWRISETNSFVQGGTPGVSNTQGAALWALDYMDGVALHGGSGLNFHGGTSSQFPLWYTPITFSGNTPTGVQGVYYGQLLWSLAGTGAIHSATTSGGPNVTAFAIGKNVIVTNENTYALAATITLPAPPSSALVYLETAPSLAAITGLTIAGSAVAADGTFHPAPVPGTISGNKIIVRVPADSAVLVVVQ